MSFRFKVDKLVRDNTFERWKNEGVHFKVRQMNEEEFKIRLKNKIIEEAKEVASTSTKEDLISELADLMEVMESLARIHEISLDDIVYEKEHKLKLRGGFQNRIYASCVDIASGNPHIKYYQDNAHVYPCTKLHPLPQIAVIGLGYVGLPVAVAFSKLTHVIGFDINKHRLEELSLGYDRTHEVDDLTKTSICYTFDPNDLKHANFFIITVPTPVDQFNKPDFTALIQASETVGAALKKGDIVVYESTLYPGATEDVCVPILEKSSGLLINKDFYVGYSPERINPGDKLHTLSSVKKVVSASHPHALDIIAQTYSQIVHEGIYKASSIRVAEAAKVIENIQRDVNIALINELAVLFSKLHLDTLEVLEAASTKWNFLPFKPGLVGGHCIGVDPYYLTYKAESIGYYPQMILSGRRINNSIPEFIVYRILQELRSFGKDTNVIILGLTFKENCPDIRNTKVVDLFKEFQKFGMDVQIFDPCAEPKEVESEHGLTLTPIDDLKPAQAIVVAVAHDFFKESALTIVQKNLLPNGVVFDVKGILQKTDAFKLIRL